MKKFLKMICVMMALSVLMSLMTACNSKSKHDGDKLYEACMLMSSLRGKELSQAETKLEESFGIKLLKKNETHMSMSTGEGAGYKHEYETDIRIQCINDTDKSTQIISFNKVEIHISEKAKVTKIYLIGTAFANPEEAETKYTACREKMKTYFSYGATSEQKGGGKTKHTTFWFFYKQGGRERQVWLNYSLNTENSECVLSLEEI